MVNKCDKCDADVPICCSMKKVKLEQQLADSDGKIQRRELRISDLEKQLAASNQVAINARRTWELAEGEILKLKEQLAAATEKIVMLEKAARGEIDAWSKHCTCTKLEAATARITELQNALPMRDEVIQQLTQSTNKANGKLRRVRELWYDIHVHGLIVTEKQVSNAQELDKLLREGESTVHYISKDTHLIEEALAKVLEFSPNPGNQPLQGIIDGLREFLKMNRVEDE